MKISRILNSNYIFTFLVMTGSALALVTSPAMSQTAMHNNSFDASVFISKKGNTQVNIDDKKPKRIPIVTVNKKGKGSKARSITAASQDSWEEPIN